MQLNNYFNLKRFSRLLKQDLLINRTKYFLIIIGFVLVSYLFFFWFLGTNKMNIASYPAVINNLYSTCFSFYLMAVAVVVGTAFPDLSDKIKTSNYLLNPGSTFEKFLVQFLTRIGFFVPLALMIFWITIRLAKASLAPELLFENTFFNPKLVPYFEFRLLVTRGIDKLWETKYILATIFGLFSYGIYLFAGTTFFKRYALVKTVILSAVALGISIFFTMILCHIFYPQETFALDMDLKDYPITNDLSSWKLFFFVLSFFSWMFFLSMAYFKLKEKEV